MGKHYKVWIEIEEHSDKGEPKGGGEIGILPDCVGTFKGKGAKARALAHIADIVAAHGVDPENSDAVNCGKKARHVKP